jgi:hypothetical protein
MHKPAGRTVVKIFFDGADFEANGRASRILFELVDRLLKLRNLLQFDEDRR